MACEYRIVDLGAPKRNEVRVVASSPERAVFQALGEEVVRSGSQRELRAKVYFQHPGQPISMVRLYSRVGRR